MHPTFSSHLTTAAMLLLAAGLAACDGKVRDLDGRFADCTGCHDVPPASGAHAKHTLAAAAAPGSVGSTSEFLPPDTTSYAFGCANCHPVDTTRHATGVDLSPAGAPAGSLKSFNDPAAAYDADTGTCTGVYCHSSGQATPAYVTTPGWASGEAVGCGDCHGNPPNRSVDGAGVTSPNSHVGQFTFTGQRIATGHFAGLPAALHQGSAHGGGTGTQFEGDASAPITCQTCHYRTADRTYTGASGFYYLNPDGTYDLDPADPAAVPGAIVVDCAGCHSSAPPAGNRVMPYFHVNGVRDVDFDPRQSLSIPGTLTLPGGVDLPSRPYWFTRADMNNIGNVASDAVAGVAGRADAGFDGTTLSLHLGDATWDAGARRCSNVACHYARSSVTWGEPLSSSDTCLLCH